MKNIEDLYKLSPVQQDLLAGDRVGQLVYAVRGRIDRARLQQACEQALARHATLRTAFFWKNLEKPVQAIQQNVSFTIGESDADAERSLGFDLNRAPLLRVSLLSDQLIVTYHPLILDEVSARMIVEEILSDAIQTQSGSFKQYISWLRQQDTTAPGLFWTNLLRGAETPSTIARVSGTTTNTRARQASQLAESSELQAFCQRHQISKIALLLGAWALLVCCYNDEDDAVFDVTFSGRPPALAGIESVAGPFSHALPARVNVRTKESLVTWLRSINDWYLAAEHNQHVSRQDIQRWSNITAPFESVIAVISDLGIEPLDHHSPLAHPLVITLQGESISLSYDETRFEDTFISQLLDQLKGLLHTIVRQPELKVNEVSLVTTANLTTAATTRREELVHELFERQVALTPQATALAFGEQSFTYLELNERANQLAHHLRSLGCNSETNVAVCMHRSLETGVSLLAILKAGGVYIPLDPQLPSERLTFMLAETNAPILLTQQDLLFDLPPIAAAAEVVCVDMEWDTIAQQSADNPAWSISPSQTAYIIYTSGSTGRPKGVCIPHAAAASHLAAITTTFGLNDRDRVLQFASLSFDVSIEQILAPLTIGATVVLRPSDVWNASEFWDQVCEQRLTMLNLPPAYWNQITKELDQGAVRTAAEKLRLMIVGGDVMLPDAVRRWRDSPLRNVRLLNAYGPTETVITSTVFDLPRAFANGDRRLQRVPIGTGVGCRQLYVLDREGRSAVLGGRGELHIGGVELARGYFSDPSLTADRFLPDPFSATAGARMYRTGDMVRRLLDGVLEYEGRRDGQVKLRGYRIELGDVETALSVEPEVLECAVALKERDGEKRLVAYVVMRSDATVQAWELRARLKQRLPEHMIPAAIVALDSLPLTTTGKVDRRALPEPELNRPEQEASFVAPRDETETKLAQVWIELLGITQLGVHDNFFEAGGDSLLATQAIARVNRAFQTSLPLRALFDQPTVAGLAQNLERYRAETEELRLPIEPGLRTEPLPLSYAQERLWFMAQLQKDSPLFNIATAVRLRGELQFEALQQTFTEIVRRHETLRTVFAIVDDAPAQIILDPQPLTIPVSDISSEQNLPQLIDTETRRPFDLTNSLPLRVSLLRLNADEHVLILVMHHIVSDGWSIGVLVREVAELYEAFCAALPSPLPELSIQYADFACWQRRWLRGSVLEDQLTYWRKELSGKLPPSPLVKDDARPASSNHEGVTRTFEIPKDLCDRIKQLAQQEETTLFMTLMAAFQALLHRESGHQDIIVGTDVANRNQTETESLIGFFVNLLPVRTRPSGNLTFREYVQQVREVTLGAYAHQDLPFDRLVQDLQPERNPNRAPIFQTLFVMQNAPVPETKLAGLQLTQMEIDEGVAKFDLAVFMEEKDERLIGKWNYRTDLFKTAAIEELATRFGTLLESVVNNPQAKLSELEVRSEKEAQQQQDVKRNLLKRARRQSVKTVESVVKTGYLPGCERLPLVIEPALNDVELIEWASGNRDFIETELLKHGALLFRNFKLESVEDFERFARAICPELFSEYGDLPREQMSRNVYGSTPYPANQAILFHNESSHLDRWPMKIWFFCLKVARSGGETPIVDCRKVYEQLSPEIRDRFTAQGIRYVRNFTPGLDVSWSDFFRTTEREAVEQQCAERSIECRWRDRDELQTSKDRAAVARHPKTGEMVFFNQLQLHHVSCLEPSVRESLLQTVGEERLPRNVYYRDGAVIEDDVMAAVDAAYRQAKVSFAWQEGDIMMLDNMLVAHGRNAFAGERKIVVALGEMRHEASDLTDEGGSNPDSSAKSAVNK